MSTTDGNGVKLAARKAVAGRNRVAIFIAAFAHHFWIGKTIDWVQLNGEPAATISEHGVITTVAMIDASADGIEQIRWVMALDKLAQVTRAGGVIRRRGRAWLRRHGESDSALGPRLARR